MLAAPFLPRFDVVSIDITYEGALRTRAVHGPSGTTLITDPPVDNQGKGESFSPSDLVATGLGTCMLTIMGILAERQGWDLRGARAKVKKHMVATPERRIGKLEVEIHVPGHFDEKQRTMLEKAGMSCPVHRSLHPEIEIPVRFVWGG